MRIALLTVAVLFFVPAAHAADWSQEEVCAGGVYGYFFLDKMPTHIGTFDDWSVFRSASGATYDCRIEGDVVSLRWKYGGASKSSRSTKWRAEGGKLSIQTDMADYAFRREDQNLVPE